MSVACKSCGERVERTYECLHCSDSFCVDCRTPTEHGCGEEKGSGDGVAAAAETVETEASRTVARLQQRWRSIPWYYTLGATVLLVPVSWILFTVHVFLDRLAARDGEWYPRFSFYSPILVFIVLLIPVGETVIAPLVLEVVGTWLYVVLLASIYTVQQYRHGRT